MCEELFGIVGDEHIMAQKGEKFEKQMRSFKKFCADIRIALPHATWPTNTVVRSPPDSSI